MQGWQEAGRDTGEAQGVTRPPLHEGLLPAAGPEKEDGSDERGAGSTPGTEALSMGEGDWLGLLVQVQSPSIFRTV